MAGGRFSILKFFQLSLLLKQDALVGDQSFIFWHLGFLALQMKCRRPLEVGMTLAGKGGGFQDLGAVLARTWMCFQPGRSPLWPTSMIEEEAPGVGTFTRSSLPWLLIPVVILLFSLWFIFTAYSFPRQLFSLHTITAYGFPRQLFQRRLWHPTPVLLPGKSHGWRTLVGCSPWGR